MANGDRRDLEHIYLRNHGTRESFTSPKSGRAPKPPERNREVHANRILAALSKAIAAGEKQIDARDPRLAGGAEGFYLEVELPRAQQSALDRLEDRRGRHQIELVSVRSAPDKAAETILATVFVPKSKKRSYQKKVEDYRSGDTPKGAPKNAPLVAAIETVRLATARSMFTDDSSLFPAPTDKVWWELWIRAGTEDVLAHAASAADVELRGQTIEFAERDVVLARASAESLEKIIENTDAIAELRLARDTPADVLEMGTLDQAEWLDELVARIEEAHADTVSVCVLDSGTTVRHPLIAKGIEASDALSWNAQWPPDDRGPAWRGHGTKMSGLVLYGDLFPLLRGSQAVRLSHRLESVKILPDQGSNPDHLFGHITAEAVARIEVQAPDRARAFCLAVTSKLDGRLGRPTSWSAKVDDLAYGEGEVQRLIIVSAGNIDSAYVENEYLTQNDSSGIESPAQAWNALTVGALTEKVTISNPVLVGWKPLAPAGDLSPLSRTSLIWEREWPIKPDVVLEGGNHAIDPATSRGDPVDDLQLVTTHSRPNERPFTTSGDTSAATALASRMAAQILSERPVLWPETVRALIVHSASWTSAMRGHLPVKPKQRDKQVLLRRYGYGKPDIDRAKRSLKSDVTVVIEDDLRPFVPEGSVVKTRDMIVHSLPWPRKTLEALGEAPVTMKVTLSYFIEPNPGERGWTKRHQYRSHGLRFEVKRAEESNDDFRRRINAAARDEDEAAGSAGADDGWILGPHVRNRGSIHSDTWEGSAVDLASRYGIAVFPTGGWWREKPALKRGERPVRYSLVVTLTGPEEIDLYTEIQSEVDIDVEIDA